MSVRMLQIWMVLLIFSCTAMSACRSVPPSSPAIARGSLVVSGAQRAGAIARLRRDWVHDFSTDLIAHHPAWSGPSTVAPDPFGALGQAQAPKQREIFAFGDPMTAAWTGGVALSTFGASGSDVATNGVAVRNYGSILPARAFIVTKNGLFIDLDPNAPATGYNVTNLDSTLSSTFTHTYVAMSGSGSVAFVISDEGNVFAINLATAITSTTPPSHAVMGISLGVACNSTALFVDPLASQANGSSSQAYAVTNTGKLVSMSFTDPSGNGVLDPATFIPANFSAGVGAAVTPITTGLVAATTDLVKSAPLAIGGKIVVGDRRGNLNLYDVGTATLKSWLVNPGWPIETPPVIDCDDDLTLTDLFVPAGGQLYWVNLATNTVRNSFWAVVENKGGTSGNMSTSNYTSYLNLANTTLTSDNTYRAFSLYNQPFSNAVQLPNQSSYIDYDRVTHCGYMTGQPPIISAYVGASGRNYNAFDCWNYTSPPTLTGTPTAGGPIAPLIHDGQPIATACLQGPVGIDLMDDGTTYAADDGSLFIADTQHCAILFKPATSTSGQKWATSGVLAGTLNPNALYLFAGSLDADNTFGAADVGNGNNSATSVLATRLTGFPARGTNINLCFGLCVGNQGLYFTLLNKFGNKNGGLFFIPRVGVSTAFGTAVSPGNSYNISSAFQGQGVIADRRVAGQDTVYAVAFPGFGTTAAVQNRILRWSSTSSADYTVFAGGGSGTGSNIVATTASFNAPTDVSLDDFGNLIISERDNNRIGMVWAGGPLNTRDWGVGGGSTAGLVAGNYYVIKSSYNQAQTVSFALNDPQVPTGCIYTSSSGTQTIDRIDATGALQIAAGISGSQGDTGDGGPGIAAKLNYPYRSKGDGKGTVYVCDRWNNRIRKLTAQPGSGKSNGYMRFNATAIAGRAVYDAKLSLWSRSNSGAMGVPLVALASPFLKGLTTIWDHTTVTPMLAPTIDTVNDVAAPSTGVGTYVDATAGSPITTYTLPAARIPAAINAVGQVFRVGMATPTDANLYYYPTGIGLPTGSTRTCEFYTQTSATAGRAPSLALVTGTVAMKRSIASQPAIWNDGTNRYVYITNANALFRFKVPIAAASASDFSLGEDFTLSAAGQTANGTLYAPDTSPQSFQPNPTPPLMDENGKVYMLDAKAASSGSSYTYTLNAFDGLAGGSNMAYGTPKVQATSVTSSATDNAGIYLAGGSYGIYEAYYGLGNGRLYRVSVTP